MLPKDGQRCRQWTGSFRSNVDTFHRWIVLLDRGRGIRPHASCFFGPEPTSVCPRCFQEYCPPLRDVSEARSCSGLYVAELGHTVHAHPYAKGIARTVVQLSVWTTTGLHDRSAHPSYI